MERERPRFYAGSVGALAPFAAFLIGVAALGLSGAPDERGFWPILLGAFALGVVLAHDKSAYAETYVRGMSQPIVMTMIVAWLLAGVLGSVIGASGLVPALADLAARAGLSGGGFVVAAFLVCALVSTATGTSLGTVIVCGPLLYPAGGTLGASPAVLIGAILGGATFGDNISPVSDTTIASATTQGAPMGEVVRSRLALALPAALVAAMAFAVFGSAADGAVVVRAALPVSLGPLWMLAAPALSIVLLLRRRHLVEGLLLGALAAATIGVVGGWIQPGELFFVDSEQFSARGLVLEGMERAVGVSVFTLLLMGLVAPIGESGVLDGLAQAARRRASTPRAAEVSIFAATSGAVILTTHSVVAILTVGPLAREVGEAQGIARARRANLLDVTVCTYPFLLPFFIPTVLAASTTASGAGAGMPRVSALAAGLHNFHSWALLAVLVVAITVGARAGR